MDEVEGLNDTAPDAPTGWRFLSEGSTILPNTLMWCRGWQAVPGRLIGEPWSAAPYLRPPVDGWKAWKDGVAAENQRASRRGPLVPMCRPFRSTYESEDDE